MSEQIKFTPYKSIVDSSFWHKLSRVKLDVVKLEENELAINGEYLDSSCSTAVTFDCNSFNEVNESKIWKTAAPLEKLCSSDVRSPAGIVVGSLLVLNSMENFKKLDKNGLLRCQGERIVEIIKSGEALDHPHLLNRFSVIVYADLKGYEFVYWFAFPALASYCYTESSSPQLLRDVFSEEQVNNLLQSHSALPESSRIVFGAEIKKNEVSCCSLKDYVHQTGNGWFLCILDSSATDFCPGWQLRNLLALVMSSRKTNDEPVSVICLRLGSKFKTSFVVRVKCQGSLEEIKCVGWEKNDRDKYGPRAINLRNFIDPIKLAESSVDLNLKLMKWRLVPDLDLESVKNQRCLLLGAGTLGCVVARCLLGWGVSRITFVDEGKVSFSNPVRQNLYEYTDCDVDPSVGAKMKAEAAAAALKRIFPCVKSEGIVLTIPMPSRSSGNISEANRLDELIENHDVVFLLTDSRESRWLPTVAAAAKEKQVITVALGFDTYLVMRHGLPHPITGSRLGCYFCNDVTAPGDSRVDRTLDQQCTVTRPGVSNIAAALGVELFVSILQHGEKGGSIADTESILGSIPHSIRGFLSHFQQICPSTPAFNQCIGCSPVVSKEYLENREDFLSRVLSSNGDVYLENLTGLTELHNDANTINILELSDEEMSD